MAKDRLADLLDLTRTSPTKALYWYALAMEHRGRAQLVEAQAAFAQCLKVDAGYVPAYFQFGVTLDEAGARARAVEMLKTGVGVARTKGDTHAAGEMASQLELWGEEVD